MKTKNNGLFKDLIKHIKEEKEARMAFFYSVFYFVFIAILLVFGSRTWAQTPVHFTHEARVEAFKVNAPAEMHDASIKNTDLVTCANK